MSFAALLVALGGTSYAAFSLPNNSVGTKQLKNQAVTTKKIKNGAVTASKISTSGLTVPNALHANSADSATTAGSSQPVAFALVDGVSATVSNAKGITNANVTHPHPGVYCISGLSFTVQGAQVTTQFEGSNGTTANFTPGATGNCPHGGQVLTFTGGSSPAESDNTFNVMLYG